MYIKQRKLRFACLLVFVCTLPRWLPCIKQLKKTNEEIAEPDKAKYRKYRSKGSLYNTTSLPRGSILIEMLLHVALNGSQHSPPFAYAPVFRTGIMAFVYFTDA